MTTLPSWPMILKRSASAAPRQFRRAWLSQKPGRQMDVEVQNTTREPASQLALRSRSKAPVFVLGSVRSGTTLLYHMLLSSGGFAIYRTESHAINLLEPRFGDLGKLENRKRLMKAWLDSKLFQVSGLDANSIKNKVLEECSNGGNFLRTVMEEIARKQG